MDDQQIGRINQLLQSISYWWSIYDPGASKNLTELKDQIYDLQLNLQAAVSVLSTLQQETQVQDDVALEQFGAGPSCAVIPSLPSKIDGSENQVVPRVQHLMQTLSEPWITLEQLNELLPILKSIPPLIDDFLNKRHAMVNQLQQQDDQPGVSGMSDQPPGQPSKSRINKQLLKCEQLLWSLQTPEQENEMHEYLQRNPLVVNFIVKKRQLYRACVIWLTGLDLDDGSSPAVAIQVNPQSAENFVWRSNCIEHTVENVQNRQCNSANYRLASCQKMNILVEHVKNCKKEKNRDCSVCKRLRFFYGHHASLCQAQDNNCSVPFCFNIKQKLKQLPQCQQSIRDFLLWSDSDGEISECRGYFC